MLADAQRRMEERAARFSEDKFVGPLVAFHDLDHDEQAFLNRIFFERIRMLGEDWENLEQVYSTYVSVLHTYGIMCPHPDYWAERGQSSNGRWFTCSMCKATVIEFVRRGSSSTGVHR